MKTFLLIVFKIVEVAAYLFACFLIGLIYIWADIMDWLSKFEVVIAVCLVLSILGLILNGFFKDWFRINKKWVNKILIFLLIFTAVGCGNKPVDNSFEKYIKWCDEKITVDRYGFDIEVDWNDFFVNGDGWVTIPAPYQHYREYKITFEGRSSLKTEYPLSLKELNKKIVSIQKDSTRTINEIYFKHWKEKQPRCKSTIEGYKQWKKKQK